MREACYCVNCGIVRQTRVKLERALIAAQAKRQSVGEEVRICWNATLRDYPCLEGRRLL